MLPERVTVTQLRSELSRYGHSVTERALVDWRAKGLMPALESRGRGRGRGKEQFWRSPGIIDHAVAICELLERRYPNDEARLVLWFSGFPVKASAAREAWLSSLGKLKVDLAKKRESALSRRQAEFFDVEDEISDLTVRYVKNIVSHFGYGRQEIVQPVIDLFALTFRSEYQIDINMLDELSSLYPFMRNHSHRLDSLISPRLFKLIITFIQGHCSLDSVNSIVSTATKIELVRAHRRWRKLLKLGARVFPEAALDRKTAKFIAAGFGRILLPTIISFVRDGKSCEIDSSIREISKFCSKHDLPGIFGKLIIENEIDQMEKIALAQLVAALATIWNHRGFPFSLYPG